MATKDEDGPTYTAGQVSQGGFMRTPLREAVFLRGLALMVLLAVVLALLGRG